MSPKKKYIFITMAGLGYLYPSIRLAHILQNNNHHVLFVSASEHSIILSNLGIEHAAIKPTNRKFLDLHRWGFPDNAVNNYLSVERIINQYRPDVIVTNPLAMVSFILAEKYQLPVINVGFCEYLFPGKSQVNEVKQWRKNQFTEIYNSFRSKIGLQPISGSDADYPLIGNKYLLRSIPELNDDITVPDKVEYVGDLYFEPDCINIPLQKFIKASKDSGRGVAYIQIGRLFTDIELWSRLTSILSEIPINFIVDAGRADYLSGGVKVRNSFFVTGFIPIGSVCNDIDFVICSGQTTSVISSIIHGKQMLSIPHSTDSIELTRRLEAKKLAYAIYDSKSLNRNNIKELLHQFSNCELESNVMRYKDLFLSYSDDVVYDKIKPI